MANGLLTWVKSSYSGSQGGNCVEIAADHAHGQVLVRDTKDRDGAMLGFRAVPWRRFAAEIKSQDRLGIPEFSSFAGASSIEDVPFVFPRPGPARALAPRT